VLGLSFAPQPMSAQRCDEALRRIEAAGVGSPQGRPLHCAFSGGEGLHVSDVWDSRESFEWPGGTLTPIFGELGVDRGEPQAAEVHNIIIG
jgi:hypothetical protein